MQQKTLYRSDRPIIGGVCGGLAEYFETDPTLVRIIFVFLSLLGAGGIILYIVIWLMVPQKHHHATASEHLIHDVQQQIAKSHRNAHGLLGFFIILVGLIFLLNSFFPMFGFGRLWPLLLIFFGLILIAKE